jgi:glycine oxidase
MNIGIAGGGLAGRLAAFHLSEAGHNVTVFDANPSPSPAVGSMRAAAFTAAGMLSPIAEMESGGDYVRELGERSLTLWKTLDARLRERNVFDPDHPVESPLGLQLNDSLMVCHGSDLGSAERVIRLLHQAPGRIVKLEARDIKPLAPQIKGTLHAWLLRGEGHLFPQRAMRSLLAAQPTTDWEWGVSAIGIEPKKIYTTEGEQAFHWVFDTRGVGAASDLSVRGVRGELIVLFAPGFELNRPVRLLHPRWRVYIVPRPGQQVVVGATEIESEDRSPISVQSTMELLSAAFSIFPALAEARILWSDTNLRPATPDNLPLIETQPGLTRINGLFRHGWLLAPAVIEKALSDASLH